MNPDVKSHAFLNFIFINDVHTKFHCEWTNKSYLKELT